MNSRVWKISRSEEAVKKKTKGGMVIDTLKRGRIPRLGRGTADLLKGGGGLRRGKPLKLLTSKGGPWRDFLVRGNS